MPLFQTISTQEKIDFSRNLSLLIKSGTPIDRAFEILANQTKSKGLKNSLIDAKERIEKGSPISEIFSQSSYFEPTFSGFIRAGEESGTLGEHLKFLADWLEKKDNLDKEISRVTLYPKIIVIFALILGAILAVFILPRLVPIFKVLKVELPLTTRILLKISDFMQNYGPYFIAGVIILIILFFSLPKLKPVARIIDKIVLKIPLFGHLTRDYQLTMISQLATILIGSGLTISRALEIISQAIPNFEYKKALMKIRENIIHGTRLNEAIRNYPQIFPDIFSAIVATGEETGTVSESFNYLADFFSRRVKERAERLPVIIEPTLLIFIGFFVLFVASAIILPVYELTRGLR